ncbi:syncollin-like [Megalops cyprinoides]|uniref:syncollin-like n=1 Tax=Megalops cyprinoides TaxID=118141 RepID=UPI001863F453|nr:syncollin-like [Megalops cyprinoides]
MRVLVSVALLWALYITGNDAQCPDPGSLRDPNGAKLCARMFEHSQENSTLSCLGEHLNAYPKDDFPIIPVGWNNRISSLVVSRFCSLTVWSRSKKEGKRRKFKAGIQPHLKNVRMGLLRNWNDEISGYYCEC